MAEKWLNIIILMLEMRLRLIENDYLKVKKDLIYIKLFAH